MIEGLEVCEYTPSSPCSSQKWVDAQTRRARARRFSGDCHVEGLDQAEWECPVDTSAFTAKAFARSFPALSLAYRRGAEVRIETDGEGGVALSVVNKGGTILPKAKAAPGDSLDSFLETQERLLATALCDLSDKYEQELYGSEGTCADTAGTFAFEGSYPRLAERLKTRALEINLSAKESSFDNIQDAIKAFDLDEGA
jgi:hypothetical protein